MRNIVLSAAVGLLLTSSVNAAEDLNLQQMMDFATASAACFAIYPDVVSEEAADKMLSMARAQGKKRVPHTDVMTIVQASIPLTLISIVSYEDSHKVCQMISDYMYLTYGVDYE